jgi:putative FmdB family regulatory protein
MPTYDFRCKDCTEQFTCRLKIANLDSAKCVFCESTRVQQIHLTPQYIATSGGARKSATRVNSLGIQKQSPGMLNNCEFSSCNVGMKTVGADLVGRNLTFDSCATGIDATDSHIDLKNVKID